MADEPQDEEQLKDSTVSPTEEEQAQSFGEAITDTEEPQEARGAPGSRDRGLPPEDTGPADRPQ
jgi:hypothetical protein